jgi:hypothetical protein
VNYLFEEGVWLCRNNALRTEAWRHLNMFSEYLVDGGKRPDVSPKVDFLCQGSDVVVEIQLPPRSADYGDDSKSVTLRQKLIVLSYGITSEMVALETGRNSVFNRLFQNKKIKSISLRVFPGRSVQTAHQSNGMKYEKTFRCSPQKRRRQREN